MDCTAVHHGTRYAYDVYRCRCPQAVAARHRSNRLRRTQRGLLLAAPRDRRQDVDEVAVARACAGDRVTLSLRERAAAVARLTKSGMAARTIADRLGMSSRTVVRYRTGRILYGREAAA